MADFVDPCPDWRSLLASTPIAVGSGISHAVANNMPWYTGIAPGAQVALGMNERDQEACLQRRLAPIEGTAASRMPAKTAIPCQARIEGR
jgi:hypothetical protein